ncbi:MAG: ferrous iron transport protein A [Clostridia bacterium]|nr:ferrous iron transport protein A [Clostridia bacterium]
MDTRMGLHELAVGQRAIVETLHMTGGMRRRLLDIGLVEQTTVECVGKAPSGDPIAFSVRGAVIALRGEDCRRVEVRRL